MGPGRGGGVAGNFQGLGGRCSCGGRGVAGPLLSGALLGRGWTPTAGGAGPDVCMVSHIHSQWWLLPATHTTGLLCPVSDESLDGDAEDQWATPRGFVHAVLLFSVQGPLLVVLRGPPGVPGMEATVLSF